MKPIIRILALSLLLTGAITTTGLILSVSAGQLLNRVSEGKIAYDTFSASNGTSTDTPWTFNDEGWAVEDGKLKAGEGGGHPTGINVTDCIWEGKIKPMELVVEGPQMTFAGPDGSHAAFDYYHIGHQLRVMIGPEGSNSVFQTASFTMSTNTSHTMKVAVSNYNMKCYMDGALIFNVTDTNVTPVPSIPWTGGLHPIRDGDLGYWDDVKIWKSNKITVTNLVQGQRVKLFNASDSLVSSATVGEGENDSILDVSALTFPFTGYFQIYATDGTTLLHSSVLYQDIWGGDEYAFQEDNTPPAIENVYQQPGNGEVYPDDKVEVYANVTDDLSGVKQVILNYTTNNGTWLSKEMTTLEGNVWNATIPAFPHGTNINYRIIAEDNMNNTITTEELFGYQYHYEVVPEFPTWTLMLLILIMLTVATVMIKRKLLKTPTH